MFIGVQGEFCAERVIERSRFLAYIGRVTGEEGAKAFLQSVRERHPLATHVCYGYIADAAGNLQRFSDDGEPHGTAGMPILGVLKAKSLRETAIAVVRYFGGIKLGAGGLVRAYTAAATDAVAAATLVCFEPCTELTVRVAYCDVNAALRCFSEAGIELVRKEFSSSAEFVVAVRTREKGTATAAIASALLGRASITEGPESLHPYPYSQ